MKDLRLSPEDPWYEAGCAGRHPRARTVQGGKGDVLWTLHRLNNIDKHRLILAAGAAFRSINFGAIISEMVGGNFPIIDAYFRPTDNMCPLKAGDSLYVDAPDAEVHQDDYFRFDVALNEPGIIEGKPLLEALVQFRDRVNSIIEGFRPCLSY